MLRWMTMIGGGRHDHLRTRTIARSSSSSSRCGSGGNNNPSSSKRFRYNEKQQMYREMLGKKKTSLVIAVGPAGTGKTSVACSESLSRLMCDDISKIVVTRPMVSVGDELGFLPGTIGDKMDPWLVPLYDNFLGDIDRPTLDMYLQKKIIEICPLSYIRGRTFSSCWVIADEMQNSTPMEMKTLLTRVGTNAKIIVTGDLDQCDLDCSTGRTTTNGLQDLVDRVGEKKESRYTSLIEFSVDDVQRSEFVKYVLNLYDKPKRTPTSTPPPSCEPPSS